MRARDDQGAATIVGAIIVLAILGTALLYVNGIHVPRQGATLERDGNEATAEALSSLASLIARPADGPVAAEVPLRADAPTPPLLAGLVLSPAIAHGSLALEPGALVDVSVVVDAPQSGVPADDPTREPVAGGRMRVHLLGSATAGQPVGALVARTGGAHGEPATRALEGGAVLATSPAEASLVEPTLAVAAAGNATHPTTRISWRLPLLAGGTSEMSGTSAARVVMTPGPEARLGGGSAVHELRVRVETDHPDAWAEALRRAAGGRGTLAQSGDVVELTFSAPVGAPAGVASVQVDIWLARYQVSLSG